MTHTGLPRKRRRSGNTGGAAAVTPLSMEALSMGALSTVCVWVALVRRWSQHWLIQMCGIMRFNCPEQQKKSGLHCAIIWQYTLLQSASAVISTRHGISLIYLFSFCFTRSYSLYDGFAQIEIYVRLRFIGHDNPPPPPRIKQTLFHELAVYTSDSAFPEIFLELFFIYALRVPVPVPFLFRTSDSQLDPGPGTEISKLW